MAIFIMSAAVPWMGVLMAIRSAPARTVALAQRLYMTERTIRRWLNRLEARNHVQRVGQRGGWLTPSPLPAT